MSFRVNGEKAISKKYLYYIVQQLQVVFSSALLAPLLYPPLTLLFSSRLPLCCFAIQVLGSRNEVNVQSSRGCDVSFDCLSSSRLNFTSSYLFVLPLTLVALSAIPCADANQKADLKLLCSRNSSKLYRGFFNFLIIVSISSSLNGRRVNTNIARKRELHQQFLHYEFEISLFHLFNIVFQDKRVQGLKVRDALCFPCQFPVNTNLLSDQCDHDHLGLSQNML